MPAQTPSPAPPWHRRVLDWLQGEPADGGLPPREPDLGERYPWEPVPPAPRPPQWGAANQPALLLGQDDDEAAARDPAPRAVTGMPAAPAPTPSPQPGMAP